MREIRIIVTDTAVSFPDGQELGRVGEHNATQLIIELPDDMVAGVDYHVIKFSLLGGTITSDIITDDDSKIIYISDGKIYCTLWQQLTASRGLSFTVEAYKVVDGTPSRIAKSPLVSGLRFELSAGADVDEQGYSLAVHVNTLDERVTAAEGDIADLQEAEHTHENKSTLDGFSAYEGILPTYNEAIIPRMTVDTDYGNGTIAIYNSIGMLTSAENSEGQPLLATEIVGTIDKTHEHPNKELLDAYDGTVDISGKADKVTGATAGNFAGLDENGNLTDSGISLEDVGGVNVVDYYNDLPDDATEGELAYVRLKTESGDGAPIDLTDCPDSADVYAQIEAAYTSQGGTLGDLGWHDFEQNYTNCNFSAGALKLGTPIYSPDTDIDAYYYTYIALEFGTNYVESDLLRVSPILALVSTDSEITGSEYTVFVPENSYSHGYMGGCAYNIDADDPEEFTENGITKYKMMVVYVYVFESLTGQLHNTDGIFDGFQLNFALGWNSISLILVLDEGTGDLVIERAETVSLNDIYLPEYTFWRLTAIDNEDDEAFARSAIPEMITDTTQSTIIPPALYIRADGEWRKTS